MVRKFNRLNFVGTCLPRIPHRSIFTWPIACRLPTKRDIHKPMLIYPALFIFQHLSNIFFSSISIFLLHHLSITFITILFYIFLSVLWHISKKHFCYVGDKSKKQITLTVKCFKIIRLHLYLSIYFFRQTVYILLVIFFKIIKIL